MPEGDTVHKLARVMRAELEGHALEGLWLRDRGEVGPLAGAAVHEVAALGKHLLVVLRPAHGADWVLHVHLGMRGRWHRYRAGEAWQWAARDAGVWLEADGLCFVCFRPAVASLLRRVEVALHPVLSRLGPDLLAASVPLARVLARARSREPRSAAELLLDQRVACGIGNVYKSEILFLEGIDPFAPVTELPDARLADCYRTARALLRGNLGGWRRNTVSPGRAARPGEARHWVYGRAGEPCRRCHTLVRGALLGDAARSTYWCPGCQPPPLALKQEAASHR